MFQLLLSGLLAVSQGGLIGGPVLPYHVSPIIHAAPILPAATSYASTYRVHSAPVLKVVPPLYYGGHGLSFYGGYHGGFYPKLAHHGYPLAY